MTPALIERAIILPKNRTPEERATWAEYMREYRRTHPTSHANKPKDGAHLEPTARQLEILAAYADPEKGGRYERVAATLGISVSAVHNQMARLMARLGVTEPSQAVMKLWVSDVPNEVPKPRRRSAQVQSGGLPAGRPRAARRPRAVQSGND